VLDEADSRDQRALRPGGGFDRPAMERIAHHPGASQRFFLLDCRAGVLSAGIAIYFFEHGIFSEFIYWCFVYELVVIPRRGQPPGT